ncbi:MAG: conjugative transposon protein TraJ [Sphingobacteriales bacterium]|nr:MAG: conjugative transposon protein TraJ [Sphingobacteriales bacterium]
MKQLILLILLLLTVYPLTASAQGVGGDLHSFQAVLDQLYNEMIPMCGQLTGVARGIAGFAATWYIAVRVWRHIASAEPVDLYPLLRPFAIGLAILMFPSVIGVINSILQPTVTATSGMVQNENKAIDALLKEKERALKNSDTWNMYVGESGEGDRESWYRYTHPGESAASDEGMLESIGNDIRFAMAKASYNFRGSIKQWMSEVLQVLFEAAALCINTIRTFYLIVLAILGPLVFGLAVFDGFQHTIAAWLARYVNVFLWLPVANIFGSIIGKIQENMLKMDIEQVNSSGDTFFNSTDTAYLIFMIIGIIGYFTVPSVANYIMHAGGGNALLGKATNMAGGAAGMATGQAGQTANSLGNFGHYVDEGKQGRSGKGISGAIGNSIGHGAGYLKDKLSGKS